MHARFRIGIAGESTPDSVHELRNYGEYVHREVGGKAHVDMKQVDAATEFFVVEVSDKRFLGEVMAALKRGTRPSAPDAIITCERL